MKELTEYEIQKAKHKRLLVRNEYRGIGKYDIPIVRKQQIDINKIKFLDYTKTKINDIENAHKTVHFLCTIGSSIGFTISRMTRQKN